MDVTPPLPAGATPVARVRALMAGAKDRRIVVRWGREELPLLVSLTEFAVSGPDGVEWQQTFTLHTEELSRIGAPVLTLSLGSWRGAAGVRRGGPALDETSVKVSCIAASDERHGNNLVALLKALTRWLGAARALLVDASFVSCPAGEPYDLAVFMLMRSGRTWYQQQGFRPMLAGSYERADLAESERRVAQLAVELRAVTVQEVLDDTARALRAVEWAVLAQDFSALRFREPRLWKRDKVVEKHSRHFEMDLVRTVYELRGMLAGVLEDVRGAKLRPARSFAAELVALQKQNCSLFADIYIRLFDSEIYNWRQTVCPFNFEVLRGPHRGDYRQRLLLPVLAIARLVGGGGDVSAWMVWETEKT